MRNLEVSIQDEDIKYAIKRLVNTILKDIDKSIGEDLNLWSIFEELSNDEFILLKRNSYFADLLKSISISIDISEDQSSILDPNLKNYDLGLMN